MKTKDNCSRLHAVCSIPVIGLMSLGLGIPAALGGEAFDCGLQIADGGLDDGRSCDEGRGATASGPIVLSPSPRGNTGALALSGGGRGGPERAGVATPAVESSVASQLAGPESRWPRQGTSQDRGLREAWIVSAVPAAGAGFAPRGTGAPRAIGDPCTCDDDCYDIPALNHGCRIPKCVEDDYPPGSFICEYVSMAVGAHCDLVRECETSGWSCTVDDDCPPGDACVGVEFCKVDWCVLEDPLDPHSEMICEAQTDDGTGGGAPLSPCAKECRGGVRDGIWCGHSGQCPLGVCYVKPAVCCNETEDWCWLSSEGAQCTTSGDPCDNDEDCPGYNENPPTEWCESVCDPPAEPLGRCCTDVSPADGYPEHCELTVVSECSSGYWVPVSDPDYYCTCPEYTAGVAPSGTHVDDLGPVVPSPRACAATGNRCQVTAEDCPKVCADNPEQICEEDSDCATGGCTRDANECTDVPDGCHGEPPNPPGAEYFTALGDDYTLANGWHLRLSKFRFRGGVENPFERVIFRFWTGHCSTDGSYCHTDVDCVAGTCEYAFVDGFAVTFDRAGIHDYTIEVDCHADCRYVQGEEAAQGPFIIPPKGWVVVRSSYGIPANFHWITTEAEDVGTNDHNLLWWKGTADTDTTQRTDYPALADDVLIMELVGETIGDPQGCCCDQGRGGSNTCRWQCGYCVVSGDPCSRDADCGIDDECTFVDWQGPRTHEDHLEMVCYGGDNHGEVCLADTDCPNGGTCVMKGRDERTGALCEHRLCYPSGDWCATVADCTDPEDTSCRGPCDSGGCCLAEGGCAVVEPVDCQDPGDIWLGYGTTCMPNCCAQVPTGADCACHLDYYECQEEGGDFDGRPCAVDDDCGDPAAWNCVERSCPGPDFFESWTKHWVGDEPDPPDYFTFTGDSTDAEFGPHLGDDCSLGYNDPGWYEGFILMDDTPDDDTDDCWLVTIDLCCNEPIKRPAWVLLRDECPCGAGGWVTPDVDEYGNGRYGFGVPAHDSGGAGGADKFALENRFASPSRSAFDPCNARYCCADGNFSATYTLGPGTYTMQIYGGLTCADSLQNCRSDDDCPPGVVCMDNLGPYMGHFTIEACPLAACCVNECVGGSSDGGFCDDDGDCPSGVCHNLCEETNRLYCEEQGGGIWLGAGAIEQPVMSCLLEPCDSGVCCLAPGDCEDGPFYNTEVECEGEGGVYYGGVTCNDDPCPICGFADPAYCHEINLDGSGWLINEEYGMRAGDDFVVEYVPLVSEMCWTVAFVGCAADPPDVEWHVAFYEDDNGLPGALVDPPGPQIITVDAAARWPEADSYLWDFQGHFGPVELTVGECYWIEFEGTGDGICPMYWWQGLDGNNHALVDNDGDYGPDDLVPFDFNFCLDCGIADGDCGPRYGACCQCPDPPGPEGDCTPGVLHADCLNPGGTWIVGADCAPNPCPGTPDNDDCQDAIIVSGLATENWIPTGPHIYAADNYCATDDGPDHTDCLSNGGDLTGDVWYSYRAECTGTLSISSCGDDTVLVNYDQMITVYDTGECGAVDQDLNEIVCRDDDCGIAGGPSEVEVELLFHQELLVRVGSWEDDDNLSQGIGTVVFEMLYCG